MISHCTPCLLWHLFPLQRHDIRHDIKKKMRQYDGTILKYIMYIVYAIKTACDLIMKPEIGVAIPYLIRFWFSSRIQVTPSAMSVCCSRAARMPTTAAAPLCPDSIANSSARPTRGSRRRQKVRYGSTRRVWNISRNATRIARITSR